MRDKRLAIALIAIIADAIGFGAMAYILPMYGTVALEPSGPTKQPITTFGGVGSNVTVGPVQYLILGLTVFLGVAGLFLLAYILTLLEKRVGVIRRFFLEQP
jgi:hypothetical protein